MENNNFIPQALYNEILRNVPIICVDLIIFLQGSYLLVRRNNEPAKNSLWFPGGRLRKNEKSEDAAIRISKDEVGLDCIVRKNLGVYETIFQTGPHDIPTHSVNFCYFLHAKNNNVKLDITSSEYMWIPQSRTPHDLDSRLKDFIEMVFGDN
jgi:GDP-mannose mannosyl hydrolase